MRQGVSEYFEGFKAPEEAMVYLCESVGPYLTGLSEEPPAVPPPVHPPSAEDVEDMYYGCVEGTVLDKEWANVINNGGMTDWDLAAAGRLEGQRNVPRRISMLCSG